MSSWGVTPAHGRRAYCATCGAVLMFAEENRRGRIPEVETERLTLATQRHFDTSALCRRSDGTFMGGAVLACRCERRILLPREDGLYCARCEGLVAPDVALAPPRRHARTGGAS
jgi:hypothetical protein